MMLKATLFLVLAFTVHAKNTYLVTAPQRITQGQPYHVNVNILNATEAVDVEVSILRSWYNNRQYVKVPIVSLTQPFVQGRPGVVTLTVPKETVIGNYILRVKGSGGLVFEREQTLTVARKTISVFIQTDKAVYKPGQRVHFRVFAVYPDLKIYNGSVDVDIFDPNGNRIRRWMSISEPSGVSERDLVLSDQPVLGDWKIAVSVPEFIGLTESKQFAVQHYELPKFEVKVDLPPFALIDDENLSGTIKANYTYGEGVKGLAEVRVYAGPIRDFCGAVTKSVHKAFPIDGSAEFSVPLAEIRKLQPYRSLDYRTITVVADVKEELTGKTLNGTSTVTYYQQPYKITFMESSPKTFKPGLPYRAYLKVTQQDDRPVSDVRAGVQVYTCVNYERTVANQSRYECRTFTGSYALPVLNLRIPLDGVIPVDVEIPENITQVSMRAYYKDVHASLSVTKSESASATYIQARLRTQDAKAGSVAVFDIQATSPPGMVFYQVSSRGSMVSNGILNEKGNDKTTTLTLNLDVTATMSPTAHLLVYFVKPDGEIVADSISFNVEGVFENKVSIGFSEEQATPHSNVTVNVNADLNSAVYLLAVDQSVLLLRSGNDITTDKVMDELRSYDSSPAPVDFKRWRFPVPSSGKNAQQIFQRAKVIVLTDATLYSGESRYDKARRPQYGGRGNSGRGGRNGGGRGDFDSDMEMSFGLGNPTTSGPISVPEESELKEVERTREIFPETWLWVNTTISSADGANLEMTVPDTITSWVASAFAINTNSGLGVAPTTAKLKVFRPFFVSLTLPLSVVKGEQVVMQANVFNYLETQQTVEVQLKNNSGFQSVVIVPGSEEQKTSETRTQIVSVPPGEAKAVYFPIVPTTLGSVDIEVSARTPVAADAVKRQLTVKAEGIRKELNIPVIVDLTSTRRFSQTMKVTSPQGLVEGSERIRLSVTGDLLGPTINGVEDLLALPTGCGEQNMLKFAPNIYIADYLTTTKQMTRELEAKIKAFLELGYQRQLFYQRRDGSFSTFGERDEAGSVWLTAFVVKSLYQARRYIYVDNSTIDSALTWLLDKQLKTGEFREPGRVIDRQLQGRSGSGPSLSAYVLLALVETTGHNGTRVNATRLEQAKQKTAAYLDGLPFKSLDAYPLAVTTYALSRVKSKNAGKAFFQLKNRSKNRRGMKYWDVNVDSKEKKKNNKVKSIDILTTSYALMSHVTRSMFKVSTRIMKWLTSQRSPRGGFLSSQDTTVALEALTKFLVGVQPDNYNIRIQLTGDNVSESVNITNANALVLQNIDLPSIPSELKIKAEGTGMASVELGMFYNVMSKGDDSDVFDISTVLLDDTINGFTLMTCAKHLENGSSGMCVESIQIPSGFTPDLSSAGNIAGLKRLEQKGQTVVAYFDEIGKSSTCLTLSCSRTNMVAKTKPAYISMTDYYNPNDNTVVSYQPRQLKKSNICQLCRECKGCKEKVA